MECAIGKNIRYFRRKQNITQEQLAEYLNLSFQTISKWENGISLPSVTLLPAIANTFNITIDELYNPDRITQDKKILWYEKEYQSLCASGDNYERVRLMRDALAEYPRNYKFMNWLARSLYRCETDCHTTEIISLCERILDECTIDTIRFSALQTIARTYNLIGQREKALEYAYEMPEISQSREFFLNEILDDEEGLLQLQKNIFFLTYNAGKSISCLAKNYRDRYTPEERIKLFETANAIYEDIADDGNYLLLNGKFHWYHTKIALNYCILNDADKAMEHLYKAADAAKKMDDFLNTGKTEKFTSVFLDHISLDPNMILKHWTGSHTEMLQKHLKSNAFKLLEDRADFKELIQGLEA